MLKFLMTEISAHACTFYFIIFTRINYNNPLRYCEIADTAQKFKIWQKKKKKIPTMFNKKLQKLSLVPKMPFIKNFKNI
jgi:hypothetical protein